MALIKRAILLAVLLAACTAVAGDVGTLVIYRLIDHSRGWKPLVSCDDQQVAEVQGGKYATLNVSAGKHVITSNNHKSRIELEVKPGEQYFIRVNGSNLDHGGFELVPAQQGRLQTERLEPLPATKVNAGVCRTQ
jgi:hypothetical protein